MNAKKVQSTNTTAVRLIKVKGQSALVEYLEGSIRVRKFVPQAEVIDDLVSNQVLARGIPNSHPFEEIQFTVGGPELAELLHKQDLWTIDDVLQNPKKLRSALQATLASQLKEILTIAHGEKKGVNDGSR